MSTSVVVLPLTLVGPGLGSCWAHPEPSLLGGAAPHPHSQPPSPVQAYPVCVCVCVRVYVHILLECTLCKSYLLAAIPSFQDALEPTVVLPWKPHQALWTNQKHHK